MQINKYYQSIKNCRIKRSALIHLALIGLLAYWVIGLLPKAYAEGVSLSVSPAILQIEAIPPSDIRAPFAIENLGDEPVRLKIGYKLFKAAKEDGQIEFLTEKDTFPGANKNIFENVQVIDDNLSIDSIELGPKQKKKLFLRIAVPKGEPFSDYYFSLIFLTETENEEITSKEVSDSSQNSFSSTQAGIAINVLLSIGPKENDKGYIEEFSGPFYVESGPYNFSLLIKNAGSHYITPKGIILIENMFGQTIGKVEIASENILAGTSRQLSDSKKLSSDDSHGTSITWNERFLLGLYKARLSLSFADDGPVYNRTIHFVAFPAKILIGIVISIIIIIFAYLRIRKGLSKK